MLVFFKGRLKVCTLSACYVWTAHAGTGMCMGKSL